MDLQTWLSDLNEASSCTISDKEFLMPTRDGTFPFSRYDLVRQYRAKYKPSEGAPMRFVYTRGFCLDLHPKSFPLESQVTLEGLNLKPKLPSEIFIYLIGVLETGESAVLRVRGYEHSVDICPRQIIGMKSDIDGSLKMLKRIREECLKQADLEINFEVTAHYIARSYAETPTPMIRATSSSLSSLSTFCNRLASRYSRSFEIYNNDLYGPSVFNAFLRHRSFTSGYWLEVVNARSYEFNDMRARSRGTILHFDVDINDLTNTQKNVMWDPLLSLAWDIETYNPVRGEFPSHENPNDHINLVGYKLSWHFTQDPICHIAVTLVKPENYVDKNGIPTLIIVCDSEVKLAQCHARIIQVFQPSFVIGFNDFGFDWKWMFYTWMRYETNDRMLNRTVRGAYTAYKLMCYCEVGRQKLTAQPNRLVAQFEKPHPIKIDATLQQEGRYVELDGYSCIDMMIEMQRKFPKDETTRAKSLNHFAGRVLNIGKKEDLATESDDPTIRATDDNYGEMHRIVSAYYQSGGRNKTRIGAFIYYCIIDAALCHNMMRKIDLVGYNRFMSNNTYLSLADCIRYAGGSKVRNAVLYHAEHTNKAHTGYEAVYVTRRNRDIPHSAEKYEGAYVVKPETGIERFTPVCALDIESLYPNLFAEYNIDPTKIITYEHARDGTQDFRACLAAVERLGWENVHEMYFTYQNIEYRMWSVRHHFETKQKGVFPKLLRDLFEQRVIIKKQAALLKSILAAYLDLLYHKIEVSDDVGGAKKIDDPYRFAKIIQYAQDRLAEPKFANNEVTAPVLKELARPDLDHATYVNELTFLAEFKHNEQESKKVLMNTFYGVSGSPNTFIYNMYISSVITALGRNTIIFMQEFARNRGFRIRYGDTDSMYVYKPREYYLEHYDEMRRNINEEQYVHAVGSSEYMEACRAHLRAYYVKVITIAIRESKELADEINRHYVARNNGKGSYIKIKYEETLLPCLFMIKKRYMGYIHEDEPNFTNLADLTDKDIHNFVLMKGIDVVKRGFSLMLKQFGYNIIRRSMNPLGNDTLRGEDFYNIVVEEIKHIIDTGDWSDYNAFAKSFTYKRDVKNVTVVDYVAKLQARNYPNTPEYGEKFKIVHVNKPENENQYDIYGRARNLRVSDKIELVEIAREQELPIDKLYYIDHELTSFIVFFIAYRFEEDPNEEWDAVRKRTAKHVKDVIFNQLCGIERTQEKYYDARKYLASQVANANDDDKRILQSTFSNYKRSNFKIYPNAPINLVENAGLPNAFEIIQRDIFVSKEAVEAASQIASSDVPYSTQILERAAAAYRRLNRHIIECRKNNRDLSIDEEIAEPINQFLRILDHMRVVNAQSIRTIAKESQSALE